jgi:Membrane magnesium transporter
MVLSLLLLVTGSFVLLHAAYSLQHYRSLIQGLEEAATGVSMDIEVAAGVGADAATTFHRMPPLDVWIELGVAFGLLLLSELIRSGSSLQPAAVRKGTRQKSVMAAPYVSRDFDVYASRSRGLVKWD